MRQIFITLVVAQTALMSVSARVCYVGTEPDNSGRYRFVSPPGDPCSCSRIKLGGHNTVAPKRETPPDYLESLPKDAVTIRKSYDCMDTPKADTTTVSPTQELPKTPLQTSFSECQAILDGGHTESGLYTVRRSGKDIPVYCHMDSGKGFIVIQRRVDGSEDFYRNWKDYEDGFGDLSGEFWWGNKNLRQFTEGGDVWKLRVSLTAFSGESKTYNYDVFSIGGEKYDLNVGDFVGDSGEDGLDPLQHSFSAYNKDYSADNCAQTFKGGWWFKECSDLPSNLNGVYSQVPNVQKDHGLIWSPWKGYTVSLKQSEMMIRP